MKVLVADTDYKTIEDISLILEMCLKDCELIKLNSGKDCMDILSKNGRPDILILSTNMVDISCCDIIMKIRNYPEASISNIPIIILSHVKGEPILDQAFKLGINGYVTKPVHGLELIARIKSILRRIQKKANINT